MTDARLQQWKKEIEQKIEYIEDYMSDTNMPEWLKEEKLKLDSRVLEHHKSMVFYDTKKEATNAVISGVTLYCRYNSKLNKNHTGMYIFTDDGIVSLEKFKQGGRDYHTPIKDYSKVKVYEIYSLKD